MAPVGKIAPAVTRLLKNYKGAKFTLELPSRALADIGQANSTNVFGQAVSNIARKYPKAITTVTGEIGDQFISANARMTNGERVVGELAFNGDAKIIDSIRDALFWGRTKKYMSLNKITQETVEKKTLQTPELFSNTFVKAPDNPPSYKELTDKLIDEIVCKG